MIILRFRDSVPDQRKSPYGLLDLMLNGMGTYLQYQIEEAAVTIFDKNCHFKDILLII